MSGSTPSIHPTMNKASSLRFGLLILGASFAAGSPATGQRSHGTISGIIPAILSANLWMAQQSSPPPVEIQDFLDAARLRFQQQAQGQAGTTSKPAAAGKKGAKIDPKLKAAYQQLALDRRPSAILQAWATPEPLAPDKDPKLKLPEAPPPAPKPPKAPTKVAPPAAEKTPEATKPSAANPTTETEPGAGGKTGAEAKPGIQKKPGNEARPATEEAGTELKPAKEEKKPLDGKAPIEKKGPSAEDKKAQAVTKKAQEDFKKAMAEHAKLTAKYKAEKQAIEAKRLKRKMEIFARHVTLGRWQELAKPLESLDKKTAYQLLLTKLCAPPKVKVNNPQTARFAEKNQYDFADIVSIITLAPKGMKKEYLPFLSKLVTAATLQGHGIDEWLAILRGEVKKPEKERLFDRRFAAKLLLAQNLPLEMGEFLPTLEDAIQKKDREFLNLIARHNEATYVKDKKKVKKIKHLEAAWKATIAALGEGKIDKAQKAEALKRAVKLAPKLRSELGDAWLASSFTTRPERGMEILATIGREVSTGLTLHSRDTAYRLQNLKLLKTAVDSLLEKAPERAKEWQHSLNLLADVWLREARFAYKYSQLWSRGPIARRDSFGNIYWSNYRNYGVQVSALAPAELLKLRPAGAWREMITPSLLSRHDTTIAELYLKMNEEKLAFPYIEKLAVSTPKKANDLAREFLTVWIKNNNPNQNRTSIYNFNFGYNQRAQGISLTRSKQERNLKDLAHWIGKLKAIEGIKLDTALLVRAFVASHSAAEVYRIETMEKVFGSLEDLDPKTLANMAQTMRANLASTWRKPALQKKAGTNRKQKDIQREVQKGYAIAQQVLGRALKAHPGSWYLLVARAAMIHDLNNYRNEIQKSSEFSGTRKDALAMFASASAAYAKTVENLAPNEETVSPFEFWFHAALGASDLQAIDQSTRLAKDEIGKIKAALNAMGGEASERHMGRFANALFTKLSAVNPSVKDRYLKAGFEIVGDHPQAREARKVFDYYKDLITEIKVVASVDGDTDVGTKVFGLYIDLHYTKNIERESGGFAKYLQNQANQVNRYYNYGRPQENYRDKFEKTVRTTLGQQFEVQSVTFNREDVNSKATETFGWRKTPYAYVLLKAKGEEVDRIPPIKLDLDFMDVAGYVVLPITSQVVPIDASAVAEARPYQDLEITQILDERKSKEGILSLEIKASATGLVPDLETCLDLVPVDFSVEAIEDQGVSVSQFAEDQVSIRSERLWTVSMKAKSDVAEAMQFRFAKSKDENAKVLFQRYDDADLVTANETVHLQQSYGEQGSGLWWWLLLPACLLVGWAAWRFKSPSITTPDGVSIRLPDRLTPFSVLSFLEELRASPTLTDARRNDLDQTIQTIHSNYFGKGKGEALDLKGIATNWLEHA